MREIVKLLERVSDGYGGEVAGTLSARVVAVLQHCEASKVKRWGIRGVTGVVLAEDIERILNGEKVVG